MELMEVYHETMATSIIARLTNRKSEGAEFVFGLIESAIRKEEKKRQKLFSYQFRN
jgi:hypothetical protein